jgi:glucosamine--fructose-6-phosphate aminotransferase (isomerizing)
MGDGGPGFFAQEIHEQPDALERTLRAARPTVDAIAARVRALAPSWITIAARGTSDNAARYAQYVFGARNRLSVALAAPSLFTVYDAPPRLAGALVVGVSQSGRSPDIVAVVAEARRQGALTVAITNEPASPLAAAAEHVLALSAGAERAVAATKTYTTQLLAIAMLSAAIANDDEEAWKALAGVPDAVARTIARAAPEAAAAAARCRDATRFLVLGRGFNYATAFEIALKIKETSYVLSEPYSFADFLHGPAALLEPGFPVLLIPTGFADDVATIRKLLEERAANVVPIEPAGDLPEWLTPLAGVVPGQLFALELARARGNDPDRPRGLAKVTETR